MKDGILVSLILVAESKAQIEVDVTLLVGGFLISGYITSKDKYLQHHAATAAIGEALKNSPPPDQSVDNETVDNTPKYIHLRDAKYYLPGANPVPGNTGIFIRISLESVHGFSFGKFEVEGK